MLNEPLRQPSDFAETQRQLREKKEKGERRGEEKRKEKAPVPISACPRAFRRIIEARRLDIGPPSGERRKGRRKKKRDLLVPREARGKGRYGEGRRERKGKGKK